MNSDQFWKADAALEKLSVAEKLKLIGWITSGMYFDEKEIPETALRNKCAAITAIAVDIRDTLERTA